MYGHKIWEDKWDIHSRSYTSSGSDDSNYVAKTSETGMQTYHKNEMYGANKQDSLKLNDDYSSKEKQDEGKKREDEEKTIVDSVNEEEKEKYQRIEDGKNEFQSFAKNLQQKNPEDGDNTNEKKKDYKSIEDAIKDAIKDEKGVVFVD